MSRSLIVGGVLPGGRLVVGDAGAGKSVLIKGIFPGLDLANDDEGVNMRPLPILDAAEAGAYSNHTYHLDMRFESGFTQPYKLAEAVKGALAQNRRVVVEHFELLYPFLNKRNADVLIGVGAEVIVTRPSLFGPLPEELARIAFDTIRYRKMAHTAEDLLEYLLADLVDADYSHDDVRSGFVLRFQKEPPIDLPLLAQQMDELIARDLPISYVDEHHVSIDDHIHLCSGPRLHVRSTGGIEKFKLLDHMLHDPYDQSYLLVGLVGTEEQTIDEDLNRIAF